MILVDTSVWIDHLRKNDTALQPLLQGGKALLHPIIIGELAMGTFERRERVLSGLLILPQAFVADHDEVLALIGRHTLFGISIGYIDCHLLASVHLTPGASLWTRDKRLKEAARRVNLPVQTETYIH